MNDYEVRGDITAILIESKKHGNREVIIDTDDLNFLLNLNIRWCARQSGDGDLFYAQGHYKKPDGKDTVVQMHRMLLKPDKGMVVDHINHNGLDNRRKNLRQVTNSQNQQNKRGAYKNNNTTKIRGVSYNKSCRKYEAYVYLNGKKVFTKLFNTLEEATETAKQARLKYQKYATK